MDSGFPWWILLVVVFFGIFVYLMLMLFLPEWVGITGKTALENEKSHREGSEAIEPVPKGRMRMRTMAPPPPPAPTTTTSNADSAEATTSTTSAAQTTAPPTLTLVKKSETPTESED